MGWVEDSKTDKSIMFTDIVQLFWAPGENQRRVFSSIIGAIVYYPVASDHIITVYACNAYKGHMEANKFIGAAVWMLPAYVVYV